MSLVFATEKRSGCFVCKKMVEREGGRERARDSERERERARKRARKSERESEKESKRERERESERGMAHMRYGVATISRLLQIIGLFCRIPSLL